MHRDIMIACYNIQNELEAAVREAGAAFPILYLPCDLHQNPDRLRSYLQDTIDRLINVDRILLPMGQCGNGTLGLCSQTASLVLPRCADCIDLLLSDKAPIQRNSRAFYFTDGWLDNPYSIDTEFTRSLEKYGEELTKTVMNSIYANYESFIVLDTQTYDLAGAEQKIGPLARATGIGVRRQQGRFELLRRMARLELEEGFVVVKPGETVGFTHFNPKTN